MRKLLSFMTKASSVLAALTLVVATSSVASCCHYWFAQPEEPEELRRFVNKD